MWPGSSGRIRPSIHPARERIGRYIVSNGSGSDLQDTAGFLGSLVRQARLGWRLMRDGRVPGWIKLIPIAALVYFLSPIDLIPDWVIPGLGEVDDIVVILLALKMFVDFSPDSVVAEHLDTLLGKRRRTQSAYEPATIDVPYRVLDED
jgi:uncharacterized membrane protein YkvA (DUF1232 family)